MSEFTLINDYFTWNTCNPDIKLSVGDDAAIIRPQAGEDLIISVDTSISGRHFPHDTPAADIGHKTLAVNLSDLAAMGATPAWFTLALSLPEYNPDWLQAFSNGMRTLADQHSIALIGGDTTRGALSITIQVAGTIPAGTALLRSGAKTGDLICVSGYLGDAAAGLACLQGKLQLPESQRQYCINRLNRPTPQVRLGELLRGYASSCMDISDGLLADLGHILQRSQKGAHIKTAQLPFSPALMSLPTDQRQQYTLSGGDDYELLFTLPADKFAEVKNNAAKAGILITAIGEITSKTGELLIDGKAAGTARGYNHFPATTAT
ncbi:MAG: thiamine-phosphate kinase [Thiolinea sp.]